MSRCCEFLVNPETSEQIHRVGCIFGDQAKAYIPAGHTSECAKYLDKGPPPPVADPPEPLRVVLERVERRLNRIEAMIAQIGAEEVYDAEKCQGCRILFIAGWVGHPWLGWFWCKLCYGKICGQKAIEENG